MNYYLNMELLLRFYCYKFFICQILNYQNTIYFFRKVELKIHLMYKMESWKKELVGRNYLYHDLWYGIKGIIFQKFKVYR